MTEKILQPIVNNYLSSSQISKSKTLCIQHDGKSHHQSSLQVAAVFKQQHSSSCNNDHRYSTHIYHNHRPQHIYQSLSNTQNQGKFRVFVFLSSSKPLHQKQQSLINVSHTNSQLASHLIYKLTVVMLKSQHAANSQCLSSTNTQKPNAVSNNAVSNNTYQSNSIYISQQY